MRTAPLQCGSHRHVCAFVVVSLSIDDGGLIFSALVLLAITLEKRVYRLISGFSLLEPIKVDEVLRRIAVGIVFTIGVGALLTIAAAFAMRL